MCNNEKITIKMPSEWQECINEIKGNTIETSKALESLKKSIIQPNMKDIFTNIGISDNLKEIFSSLAKNQLGISEIISKSNSIENATQALKDAAKKISDIHISMAQGFFDGIKINNYFKGIESAIEAIKKNPNNFYNWSNYYRKLSEYFWVYPLDMSPEQLCDILEKVDNEEKFDELMLEYFDEIKIGELFNIMKTHSLENHEIIIDQIELAFLNESYALANIGLLSIMDDILSQYMMNKSCSTRVKMFKPILEDLKAKKDDIDADDLKLMILSNNVDNIYKWIDFKEAIAIPTHKKVNRHTSAHGKFFSSNEIDTIMILNTLCYLIMVKDLLKEYEGKLFKKFIGKNKYEFYLKQDDVNLEN